MSKPKISKAERKIKHLEGVLARRQREIERTNKYWQDEISKIQRRNRMTQFQIEAIKKGEWPL